MKAPKGFRRFTLEDRSRWSDRWLWHTHYKKIRGGFEYWRESEPGIVTRETYISWAASAIETIEIKGANAWIGN